MSPWTLALLLVLTSLGCCETVCSYNDLLKNLSLSNSPGAIVRPVKDWTTPSIVLVDMELYTIINLDTSLQILTTFIWFTMIWDNEFVSWQPDDFCGIDKVFVSSELFWKPDLYIYEMTQDEGDSPKIPYYLLNHNGTVLQSIPLRIISSCNLDIFKFPFDIQSCTLSFGPYVHSEKDIIMLPRTNSTVVSDTSKNIFVSRGDWALVNITVSNTSYLTDGEAYSQVIFQITIKRSPIIYVINLIIPAGFLVLLDIASMFIQMGTGERLGFKITVVLGFSVLLLILNDLLPNSDSPPVLGIFCCVCLAVMVFSIIGSIAISFMLTQSATQPYVPVWIKVWVLKHLARVLCFKTKKMKEDTVKVTVTGNKVSAADCHNNDSKDIKTETEVEDQDKKKNTTKEKKTSVEAKLLKMLLVEILTIHQDLIDSKNETDARSEWYIAALVVDRLVLIVYLCTVVIIFAIVVIVWAS
ncbi:5-hydroxytryptamine receptor 3A-like [Bombina bombina]|uniref:5-hydroxytryptamine receptor 3A-like n=1 Tax=Bombina bombina TaxID=8345 RepID=UPI00235A52B6|nr:5-hydroxytryptamine receptor 3A-like [Bombina bombina]